jgi:hypothetical protein
MHTRHVFGTALLLLAAAVQAEPPQRHSAAPKPGAPAKPGTTSVAPLKLQVGDVRKYMMPSEYNAAIGAPDAEKSTIVVEGQRVLPVKSTEPVAQGIIAPFWAVAHPTQAWRIFVPDPNAPAAERPDVVPKPEFRLGP